MNRILVVLGVLFLLAAAGTFMYEVTTKGGLFGNENIVTKPYDVYAFPLLVGGVVLAAVGLVRRD